MIILLSPLAAPEEENTLRHLLLLTLLSACATAPHRKVYYCDGVETCPPEAFTHPGYTPAGAGLPEYRPTEEEEEAPRSPYKRVLPQTPETRRQAGLWAATGTPVNGPAVKVFGISVPTAEGMETAQELMPANACSFALDAASAQVPGFDSRFRALSPEDQKCLAAASYFRCLSYVIQRYDVALKVPLPAGMVSPYNTARERAAAHSTTAYAFYLLSCFNPERNAVFPLLNDLFRLLPDPLTAITPTKGLRQ